ncbi:MAG: adenosylmethionine--8-amino-7-oxononanoate transaminase [Myxococcota bacterium]
MVDALVERDAAVCWHPFTQAATAPAPLPVVAAEGAYLVLADGRRILDGLSSWWSTLHGHAHPKIVSAIAKQAATLDHVLFAGCTHPPAVELAERLLQAAPAGFARVFYSDDGSTAVEVGLKMAFQAHINAGHPEKRHFICLEGGYHGDTIGAMSAGDPGTFGEPFAPLMFPVTRVRPPLAGDEKDSVEAGLARVARAFEDQEGRVAAVVVEPLVQGAAGMRMTEPAYLRGLRTLCDEHGAYLIADEVMTGFGRTGTMFAQAQAGVRSDILCLSKGISGGALPLAATLTDARLYERFLDSDMRRGFLHGHTYTANPIACAAARASLSLFEEEQSLSRVAEMEAFYRERLPELAKHTRVRAVRWRGSIGVVEVESGRRGYYDPVRDRIQAAMLERGYLIRPLGSVVYTLPPYCVAIDELAELYDQLERVLDAM